MYGKLAQKLHPYYTFYYHTIAFSVGAMMARYQKLMSSFSRKWLILLFLVIWFLSFVPNIRVISKIVYPMLLIPIFSSLKLKNISVCKKIRNMSILYYTMHFAFIFLYNALFVENDFMMNSIVRYIVILTIVTIVSLAVLYSEAKPKLAFLKYLH